MTAYGPKAHLGSAVINWGPYYIKATRDAGRQVDDRPELVGREGGRDRHGVHRRGRARGNQKRIDEVKAGLKDGSFVIWKGPIMDNTGKELLGKDVLADDKFLGGLKTYVKGVEGKVPGN